MTPAEVELYSKNHRLSYEKYQSLDLLLDDERRVLEPEQFTNLRDALICSPVIKNFHA